MNSFWEVQNLILKRCEGFFKLGDIEFTFTFLYQAGFEILLNYFEETFIVSTFTWAWGRWSLKSTFLSFFYTALSSPVSKIEVIFLNLMTVLWLLHHFFDFINNVQKVLWCISWDTGCTSHNRGYRLSLNVTYHRLRMRW